ncbi:MAG: DegT/DnrJ/EryC1/StrS family aminotransferase [Proteobacteria bacterium]|nr:DegT/DnrJ/EryC1/StrS family aminotransferase [Pseudomonadota bacterium]
MAKRIQIKLADPGIDAADKKAAMGVLDSGQLVCGPRGREFEVELEKLTRTRHAIAVSSGTTALLAAMRALGIGPYSTVVVPGFTFPAPAAAAAFLGADVRVCDVDPATFCISPDALEPYIDDDVSLVVAVDQFGVPAPVPALERMLAPRNIPVLVDAACSIGSTLDGEPCGSFGTAATFSFHPRKVVTTSEGGAVLTNSGEVASRVRLVVNHGLKDGVFDSFGLNLRLSEMGAAIGEAQLKRLKTIIEKRRALARRYKVLPLQFQGSTPEAQVNYQTLAALLPKPLDTTDRADFLRVLREQGIEANIASYCLAAVPALGKQLEIDPGSTPVAFDLHERGVALPLHPGLSFDDVDEVVRVVLNWLHSREVL